MFLIQNFNYLAFSVFPTKILSRGFRLSRTSRALSRLIRQRLIACDGGPKQTVKIFPVFGFEHRQKKVFSKGPASSGDLHPKRSPQPDFRDRGVIFRATKGGQKQISWGGELVTYVYAGIHIYIDNTY